MTDEEKWTKNPFAKMSAGENPPTLTEFYETLQGIDESLKKIAGCVQSDAFRRSRGNGDHIRVVDQNTA